jgi:glycosyltransferase involved in cell wall biosynthesis
VHANDHRAFWNAAVGARLAGARVIFNVRGSLRQEARSQRLWRVCLVLCDSFLVLSEEMVEGWRAVLQPTADRPRQRRKFAYIRSIVDMKRYSPVSDAARSAIRNRLRMDPERAAVVYVGRCESTKNQLDFIRTAVRLLKEYRSNAVVYFVGDFDPARDAYAAECEAAVAELDLAGMIRFVGYTADTNDWYRAADVVVLASKREGLPRCIIEALACGAPVASFAVCSAREVLEAFDCGIVVPHGDYTALTAAIERLLNDDAMSEACRDRGPRVATALFDPTRNAGEYCRLVEVLSQ